MKRKNSNGPSLDVLLRVLPAWNEDCREKVWSGPLWPLPRSTINCCASSLKDIIIKLLATWTRCPRAAEAATAASSCSSHDDYYSPKQEHARVCNAFVRSFVYPHAWPWPNHWTFTWFWTFPPCKVRMPGRRFKSLMLNKMFWICNIHRAHTHLFTLVRAHRMSTTTLDG